MRKFLLYLLSAALLVPVFLGISAMQVPTKPAAPIRFLALGDSYTIGQSVAENARWPMQLKDSLVARGYEVEWYKIIARTGWKTKELADAIAQTKPEHDYNLVSLMIGVNDFFQGRSLDEYKGRFQNLLQTAIAHAGGNKNRVFVVSIPDYSATPHYEAYKEAIGKGIDDFNQMNRKISLATGVHYVDVTAISRQGFVRKDWVADDGLHPSARQYQAWVLKMLPTVLQILDQQD